MISVEGLTKTYGKQVAVDGISFSVGKGEIVGFLGPNGAGKSTTMNIITGYLSATAGKTCIAGIDVAEEPEAAKRKVGYLPEQPPLYGDMSVDEYLSFVAELKGIPRKQRAGALEEARELTGITDVRKRVIKNLSKGYRQRVGLAQALVAKPEVLILDEPTVGLDPKQIAEIRTLIRKIGESRTIILSSHILPEVSAVCSRVLIMDHGRIVADGSAGELAAGLSGSNNLILRIAGGNDVLERVLQAAGLRDAGLVSFEFSPAGEALIKTAEGSDPRPALFWALADAKLPILSLRLADATLEDVFLRLTTRETEEASA